jgi:hypothetical protein
MGISSPESHNIRGFALACCAPRKWGAVVLIASPAYPFPVTVAGLKLQLLSLGRPEQELEEKVIVPL